MQHTELASNLFPRLVTKACLLSGVLMAFLIAGCGGSTTTKTSTATSSTQTYFAPYVNGAADIQDPLLYTVSNGADSTGTFSRTTYNPADGEVGPQVLSAGTLKVGERGLRSLEITAIYTPSGNNGGGYVSTSASEAGSFAVELADQAGGLVQMVGQAVQPLVAAKECPNFTSKQTYQFVTIPRYAAQDLTISQNSLWNPTTDTAYGSADIVTSGSTVTFQNIHQYTLPSVGGTGAPAQPSASSVTGACGSTTLGYITGVPGQYVVENPGAGDAFSSQAAIGIGSTGLLVEDNGSTNGTMTGTSPTLHYENVLGAGTGAVGLPKPSSDITSAVVGAQYLGFIYGAGEVSTDGVHGSTVLVPWSSHLASFGFSTVPSSCSSVAASTGTLIYGGDFTNNDPTTSSNGFGNCDFAIDFGTQDASNNGLYSQATVWIGSNYAANTTGKAYSFKAVAIAGQLNGKNAIFVIGYDSTQPWAIYLLQSN